MRDEVEEFLRRAAQRRAQAETKRRESLQQAAQPPAPRPAPIVRPPLRQAMPTIEEPLIEIIDAEEADTSDRFSSSISQHLRGTNEIARHASSLGAEVDLADDKLEARLHKTFDHQIGSLKDTTTAAPERLTTSSSAAGEFNMRKLLANAENIRNAVILSEIIARPVSRWE